MTDHQDKTQEQWRAKLTAEQYGVTREKGTEPPFSGTYNDCKDPGTYMCICCDAALFRADDKFDSGTGWPSYVRPYSASAVRQESDSTLGVKRIEVLCANCDAHLGHVFPDGPGPSGMRYCINSVSLNLKEE